MKLWLALFLPGFLLGQPLQRGNVDLRVNYEARIKTETQWANAWGDFSEDYLNSRMLDITLRQIGGGNPAVDVQWYFIGRDHTAGKLYVYDAGEFSGSIARGGVKLLPYSKELVENREKFFGSNQLSGAHPWGWCVIVSQDGRRLEKKASTPELVQWTLENRDKALAPPPRNKKRPELHFIPQALGIK